MKSFQRLLTCWNGAIIDRVTFFLSIGPVVLRNLPRLENEVKVRRTKLFCGWFSFYSYPSSTSFGSHLPSTDCIPYLLGPIVVACMTATEQPSTTEYPRANRPKWRACCNQNPRLSWSGHQRNVCPKQKHIWVAWYWMLGTRTVQPSLTHTLMKS